MRKFGRRVLYEPQALEAWIDSKLTTPRRSTSDVGDENLNRPLSIKLIDNIASRAELKQGDE